MTCFWVISVEDYLFLGYQRRRLLIFEISASMMTYFRVSPSKMTGFEVISVEDDLVLSYQRRRLLIFRLSASKMTYFRAICVNRAFITDLIKSDIKGMVTGVHRGMGGLRPGETGVVGERRRAVN